MADMGKARKLSEACYGTLASLGPLAHSIALVHGALFERGEEASRKPPETRIARKRPRKNERVKHSKGGKMSE